jgi:hypothetical protein
MFILDPRLSSSDVQVFFLPPMSCPLFLGCVLRSRLCFVGVRARVRARGRVRFRVRVRVRFCFVFELRPCVAKHEPLTLTLKDQPLTLNI